MTDQGMMDFFFALLGLCSAWAFVTGFESL